MKNGLTELVFIIDKSASMRGLEEATIGGFNTLLREQQAAEGEAVITTALFDARFELLHDRINVKAITPLTREDYKIGRGTALLDAIGLAMHKVRKAQRHTKEEYRPEKTLFVIITDGEENHSRTYTAKMIRERIERRRRKYGWDFLLFSANMDAVSVAAKLGIDADHVRTFRTDSQGIQTAYSALSALSTSFRMSGPKKEDPPRALDNSTIREHWSEKAVFTGAWHRENERAVPAEELFPGELSATMCEVGCYTVRSAQRVYRVNQDRSETPASAEELETYKSKWNDLRHDDGWLGDLRLVHEISARHHDGPEREFILVDGARQAHRYSWTETIKAIYTVKENAAVPDEYASLFVYKHWVGSCHSANYWSKLDPTGRMWGLSLNDMDEHADDRRFCVVEQPPIRFLVPESQTEGGHDIEH